MALPNPSCGRAFDCYPDLCAGSIRREARVTAFATVSSLDASHQERGLRDGKERLIDRYAVDELPEAAYVEGNVAVDQELQRLNAKRADLLPLLHNADVVAASVRDFCDAGRARLERCLDFEGKRAFLVDYFTRIVYTRYKVSIGGSVPIMPKAGQDHSSEAVTLEFRIEGDIKGAMLHGRRTPSFPDDGRPTAWGSWGGVKQVAAAPGLVRAV
jgi:hypothetical protein